MNVLSLLCLVILINIGVEILPKKLMAKERLRSWEEITACLGKNANFFQLGFWIEFKYFNLLI
jgi:hypothetical protein